MSKKTTFTGQVIDAIKDSGKTRYAIFKETGIDQAALSRMVKGEGWLGRDALDRLAECIGLVVTVETPQTGKTPGKRQRTAKTAGGNAAPLRR